MKLGHKFNAVNIIRIGLIVFALIRIATFIFYKGGYSKTGVTEKFVAKAEAGIKEYENNRERWAKMSAKEVNDEIEKNAEQRNEEFDLFTKCLEKNYIPEKKTVETMDEKTPIPIFIQPSLWPTTILMVPYIALVVLFFLKKDIPPILCLVNVMCILLLLYAGISCFVLSWRCRTVLYMVLFEIVFFIEIALNCAIIVLEVIRGMKKDGDTKTSAPTVASTMAPATAPPTAPAVPATATAMAPADANGGPATAPAAPPV